MSGNLASDGNSTIRLPQYRAVVEGADVAKHPSRRRITFRDAGLLGRHSRHELTRLTREPGRLHHGRSAGGASCYRDGAGGAGRVVVPCGLWAAGMDVCDRANVNEISSSMGTIGLLSGRLQCANDRSRISRRSPKHGMVVLKGEDVDFSEAKPVVSRACHRPIAALATPTHSSIPAGNPVSRSQIGKDSR
jgi:hypothetical protein